MRRVSLALLLALSACSSTDPDQSEYVHVQTSYGRAFYARRSEVDSPDEEGMVRVKDLVTKKVYTLKRDDLAVRTASKGEVLNARSQQFVYGD